MSIFENRVEAGRRLASALAGLRGSNAVILGLPRGGVPVAAAIADELELPLDVIVVRKLGLPSQPEVAMGAIGEGGAQILDPGTVALAGVTNAQVHKVVGREREILEARVTRFRHGCQPIELTGRTAVIVDDGVATGATTRVACLIARRRGAARIIVAAPVGARDAIQGLDLADEVVCLSVPQDFIAVGYHYRDFSPTTEDEVAQLLDASHRRRDQGPSSEGRGNHVRQ